MSLYHQTTMMTHGQPYRAPLYGHTPPVHEQQRGPAPYQQYAGRYPAPTPVPPLQPMYHMDANSFRDEYMRRLASLTENSRPIIQNLLLFAQEYPRWSDIVGQCIQTHIRSVSWLMFPQRSPPLRLECRMPMYPSSLYVVSLHGLGHTTYENGSRSSACMGVVGGGRCYCCVELG